MCSILFNAFGFVQFIEEGSAEGSDSDDEEDASGSDEAIVRDTDALHLAELVWQFPIARNSDFIFGAVHSFIYILNHVNYLSSIMVLNLFIQSLLVWSLFFVNQYFSTC